MAVDELPSCGCAIPGETQAYLCYCAVDDLLRIIRRRYSLAVMNAVRSLGTARFHDVETALPAASTSTLAETLRALVTAQLLTREGTGETLPRSSYRLTPAGEKLLDRLRRLLGEVRLGGDEGFD